MYKDKKYVYGNNCIYGSSIQYEREKWLLRSKLWWKINKLLYIVIITCIVWLGCPDGSVPKQESQEAHLELGTFDPWVGNIPWRRKWQPTPVLFLPGESSGQRSLVVYSPWVRKELDTTGSGQARIVRLIPGLLICLHWGASLSDKDPLSLIF